MLRVVVAHSSPSEVQEAAGRPPWRGKVQQRRTRGAGRFDDAVLSSDLLLVVQVVRVYAERLQWCREGSEVTVEAKERSRRLANRFRR